MYPTVPRSSLILEPVDLQDRLLDMLLAELYDGESLSDYNWDD